MLKNEKGLAPHLKAEGFKIAKGSRLLSAGLTPFEKSRPKVAEALPAGRQALAWRGRSQTGLTIVEALVSLVVLSFGLVPALAVLSSSTRISSLIENNLIAANLAQEGAEIMRSLRDENWFRGLPFDNGLQGNWLVQWDTNGTAIPPQQVGTNPPLKFDPVTSRYNYSTGTDTSFKRAVSVVMTGDICGCKLVVVSRVDWTQRGITRTINVETHLFDWQ